MSYERRRATSAYLPESPVASSSSSSTYRYGPRQASPPASTYFPLLSADSDRDSTRLRPTADAESHFAYSTTLRRHHQEGIPGLNGLPPLDSLDSPSKLAHAVNKEALSLWTRAVRAFTGEAAPLPPPSVLQDANGHQKDPKDTLSAKFAHCSVEDTISYYRTSPINGLRHSEVPSLLTTHGYNEFSVSSPEPVFIKFLKTIYESPLILLLCGSALVSAVMGNVDDAVSITVAVLIVLTVGFVQERRSEKSLEALNKLVPHHCHVIRDGTSIHILANELVPGDIVTFTTGDRIPADIRVIEAVDLEIDESSLTGETEPRAKTEETCAYDTGVGGPGVPVALAERKCIAYMGTLVRNGRGKGVIIATGTETEFGIIFSMMQDVEEKRTPLQLSMDELAKKLSIISFGVIGIICIIGVLQHRSWLDMFTIGVSLAVAAIPEGLPIVTTVTLALGVLRMSKRKAIVKKLHSVEALGCVSVICSDKTGTLTKNEMTVTEVYVVDEILDVPTHGSMSGSQPGLSRALRKTLEIGAICNNGSMGKNEGGQYVGQSTDVALLNVVDTVGMNISDIRSGFKRLGEKPFNSETKYMAVSGVHGPLSAIPTNGGLHPSSGTSTPIPNGGSQREIYYIKGSIEAILDRCKFYFVAEDSTPGLDHNTRQVILSKAKASAERGLRVLGMAYGYGNVDSTSSVSRAASPAPGATSGTTASSGTNEKSNLVFVGFQAMLDPPRKGVADSIALLQSGGVQVVMITGDAEETALAIARSLGLRVTGGGSSRRTDSIGHPTPQFGAGLSEKAHAAGPEGGNGSASGHHFNPACLTGKEIDSMSASMLRSRIGLGGVSVFARTTPRHKMRIVEAYQSLGKVVGMTGDGVNDAPALKMADIGVSMGRSGTDVAKEAADVILVDDNFSTILPAVEEGKAIFHNIQNFLSFQLSTAAAALTLITLSTMFGLSNPLNAMQILFINILMDGPPSQSLGVDPVDPAVMRKPPRKKDAPIITNRLVSRVLFSASIIVFGTLFVYLFALEDDHMSRREQTMTFTCFVFLDLVSAIQNRGLGCGLTQNKMLLVTVSVSFISQLTLIYVPFMQAIFQTQALRSKDLGILLGLAGASMGMHEMRRRYERALNVMDGGTWGAMVEEMA